MRILVTGSNGFIGKNLCLTLKQQGYDVLSFDLDTNDSLSELVSNCDFVMHLAGVNRPLDPKEFYDGNANLTYKLINLLEEESRHIPLLLSSSIQAEKDNDYGKSKKQAEELVFSYGRSTHSDVFVYRLENAFGKWCRPNYNSVVATFCYNIANHKEVVINDPNTVVPFVYIDDIVADFIRCINSKGTLDVRHVTPVYKETVQDLAKLIRSFRESRENLLIPDMEPGFAAKLYSTYLSYLPENEFAYPLKSHEDDRGSFTEFVRTEDRGQISINVSHPGVVKGNHWHHSKNEKFLVVKGNGIIRFRKIGDNKVVAYPVSDNQFEVVDIPCGYTHNIENTGSEDMVTVMWASEKFDPDHPDTFYEKV